MQTDSRVQSIRDRAKLVTLETAGVKGSFRLTVDERACVGGESLYGGALVAAIVYCAEYVTAKPAAWTSTQFLSTAPLGSALTLELDAEVVRPRLAQFHATAFRDDGTVVARCLGATATRRGDPDVWGLHPPPVPPPAECPSLEEHIPEDSSRNMLAQTEQRVALGPVRRSAVGNPAEGGRTALWYRMPGCVLGDAASQALASDLVLTALMAAGGFESRGFSLDNTNRVVQTAESEWLLLELLGEAFDGVGHGEVRVWHPDCGLLGIHQETAVLRSP